MGLSFHESAFDIKRMVGENNSQHKFWWGYRPWGAGTWRYPRKDSWRIGCPGLARGGPRTTWRKGGPTLVRGRHETHLALRRLHCLGQTPAPPGAWATPMQGADTSVTWRLGLGKKPDWLR
jgi:flavin-dependent dehydrogenase